MTQKETDGLDGRRKTESKIPLEDKTFEVLRQHACVTMLTQDDPAY